MNGRMYVACTTVAAAALLLLAAPASATHVQCGDTITTNTTLDSDVVCPDGAEYGLLIGADNVLLKMNGFAIRGGTSGGLAGIFSASPDQDGLQGVRIKRGSVQGFLAGIDLAPIDDSTLYKVNVTTLDNAPFGGDLGISLTGDRNWVEQSTVTLTGDGTNGAITFNGDDAYAWGNIVNASASTAANLGVVANGDRPRLVYNQVTGCGPTGLGGTGVLVGGYTEYAVANRNIVSGCDTGVAAFALDAESGHARVALNQTTGGSVGVRVGDTFATVGRNVARDASDTGILIDSGGTVVRRNEAYNNEVYGIFAHPEAVDGGENLASGNGDGTNPQCVNVSCGQPPPT